MDGSRHYHSPATGTRGADDITTLKTEVESLRESADLLRLMLEQEPECVKVVARDGQLLEMNAAGLAMLEAESLDEVRARPLSEFVAPEDRTAFAEAHARVMAGEKVTLEFEVVGLRGGHRWLETHAGPQCDRDGRAVALVGITRDVTEHRRTEAALREAEARLRLALHAGHIGTWDWDLISGRILWSETHEAMWGFSPGAFGGKYRDFVERIHPEDRAEVERAIDACLAGASTIKCEFRVNLPDGAERWMCGLGEAFRDHRGVTQRMVGVVLDVTDRRRQEQTLRHDLETFAAVFRSSPVPFLVVRFNDNIVVAVNAAFEAMTGRSADEIVGHTVMDAGITTQGPERDRRLHELKTQRRLRTQEIEFRRKDGLCGVCLGSAEIVDINREPFIIVTALDVTDQKRLEAQALHTQRMEAIGTLATGVAHDLNNILAPVLMGAGVLRSKLPDPEDQKMLDIIERAGHRGANVVRQLLAFGRKQPTDRSLVQPRDALDEIGRIVRQTFPSNIRVTVKSPSPLPLIEVDATQLHQVLLNLSVNARDAMPNGGRLTLKAELAHLKAEDAALDPLARPGDWVVFRVADTGEGITPEIRQKIFDPFFTTKPIGKGTGLGLSTVLGIVQSHRGFVKMDSDLGRGTEFRIFLPASQKTAAATAATSAPTTTAAGAGGEMILLVEDEEAVREAMAVALRREHYEVITAGDGADGIVKFQQHRDRIKLVITDLTMPDMDGLKFAYVVRQYAPDLPIALSSGLDAGARLQEVPPGTITAFMPKPIRTDQLLKIVQQHVRPT